MPPVMTVPAPFIQFRNQEMWNLHHNVCFRPNGLWRLTNTPADGLAPSASQRRALGQEAIRLVLAAADAHDAATPADPLTIRAIGSGWSLSDCADVAGWMLQTNALAYVDPELSPASMDPTSTLDPAQLALVQCGTKVASLNHILGQRGRSLKTSGASNGQTIVGATATGTHGSAFKVGSLHDTLRGLHIQVSGTRHYWLEPTAPVLKDAAIKAAFGADTEIVRSDAVFHSALVSFGSFGVVESVLVETEPLFQLQVRRTKQKLDAPLRELIRTLAFPPTAQAPEGELYHYDLILDPHDKDRTVFITTMHKRRAPPGTVYDPARFPRSVVVADPAAIGWLSAAAATIPSVIIKQASRLLRNQFPELDGSKGWFPLGAIFTDVVYDAQGGSTEIGVPLAQTPEALDVLLGVIETFRKKNKPYLGPIAARFVKQGRAPLAFTRFGPISCTIELPAANLPWLDEIFDAVWAGLTARGIPFTLHWGQENHLTIDNVRQMWGDVAVDTWLNARRRLLPTPALRHRFANGLLRRCGLHD